MLRRCVHGAQRHGRFRQRPHSSSSSSSLPCSSAITSWDPRSSDDDAAAGGIAKHPSRRRAAPAPPSVHHHHHHRRPPAAFVHKRWFGVSRHPDPLARHGDVDTPDDDVAVAGDDADGLGLGLGDGPLTADDLEFDDNVMSRQMSETSSAFPWDEHDDDDEGPSDVGLGGGNGGSGGGGGGDDYSDIFGSVGSFDRPGGDDDDDDELDEDARADAAYRARQKEIAAELDTRTGRLWTDDWIITDEEWMTDASFDDIPSWVPSNATRKSLESVRVYEGGVPTLGELARLELPPALPPHPGHGEPGTYAKFRKRRNKRKIQTAIQVSIHDDLKKIVRMESWEEKQEAVDGLFEVIVDRVREREPILGKLPDFEAMVEKGLEHVLMMVQSNMRGVEKERNRERHEKETHAKKERKMEAGDVDESAAETVESNEVAKENAEDIVDVMDVNSEPPVPIVTKENEEEIIDVMGVNAEPPVPIFMDILAAARKLNQQHRLPDGEDEKDAGNATTPEAATATHSPFFAESDDGGVPNLVYPLKNHKEMGVGRMVEEWQLAANKETKRVMMRDAMKEIAGRVVEAAHCCDGDAAEEEKGAARVFVVGKRGVGKTATLAGIVASARLSGHIVVYLPDGDRLRKHGFYIEPCNHRKGLYNLPEIGKEFCEQLLTSHGDDVGALPSATKEDMKDFFTEDQIRRLFKRAYKEDESVSEEEVAAMTEMSLDKILSVGTGSSALSSGCYCTVISALMKQTQRPFTVVMDEFNCYYDHGHYFHMDYDENVRKGVPLNRITILKPFLDAMGLYPDEAGTEMTRKDVDGSGLSFPSSEEAMMKWGSMIVSTSECRAVRRSFTRSLTEAALTTAAQNDEGRRWPLHVVDVERFSDVEVQHALYNFEITGVGRLRFDRGDTALNPEEVEYLRLVSGGLGQHLLDSCMIRL